jgi:hypothetical protein
MKVVGVWRLLDLYAGSAGAWNGRDYRSDSYTQNTSAPLGMNLPERPREGAHADIDCRKIRRRHRCEQG